MNKTKWKHGKRAAYLDHLIDKVEQSTSEEIPMSADPRAKPPWNSPARNVDHVKEVHDAVRQFTQLAKDMPWAKMAEQYQKGEDVQINSEGPEPGSLTREAAEIAADRQETPMARSQPKLPTASSTAELPAQTGFVSALGVELRKAGKSVGKAAWEGTKLVAAAEAVHIGRDVLEIVVERTLETNFMVRLLGNGRVGRWYRDRQYKKFTKTPLYKLLELVCTGGGGYLLAVLPWVPEKAKPAILEASQKMMAVQTAEFVKEYGTPAMRRLLAAAATIPQLAQFEAAQLEDPNFAKGSAE